MHQQEINFHLISPMYSIISTAFAKLLCVYFCIIIFLDNVASQATDSCTIFYEMWSRET